MTFDDLFGPAEHADEWLLGLFDGAPLLMALLVACALGLRHASDPDHLMAVTSLVTAEQGDTRQATRLGAWWGAGHAATLLLVGLPLIAFRSELPRWLERGAETAVGVVILVLALRVMGKWVRGDYRSATPAAGEAPGSARTPAQALGIGMLHGLAGTGPVVLLLVAALPGHAEAAAALAVFAPMSVASMAACSGLFAWLLTRPRAQPVCRTVLVPFLGAFGLVFGVWYAGLA